MKILYYQNSLFDMNLMYIEDIHRLCLVTFLLSLFENLREAVVNLVGQYVSALSEPATDQETAGFQSTKCSNLKLNCLETTLRNCATARRSSIVGFSMAKSIGKATEYRRLFSNYKLTI